MVSLKGNEIIDVPIEAATDKLKTLDLKFYELAKIFFS
jgi:hypothetical protein